MYGNKIDNLIKLKESGINVPAFTVVPYDKARLDEPEFEYPSDGERFAVRSSSNVEDGDQMSFAGQFDTGEKR